MDAGDLTQFLKLVQQALFPPEPPSPSLEYKFWLSEAYDTSQVK